MPTSTYSTLYIDQIQLVKMCANCTLKGSINKDIYFIYIIQYTNNNKRTFHTTFILNRKVSSFPYGCTMYNVQCTLYYVHTMRDNKCITNCLGNLFSILTLSGRAPHFTKHVQCSGLSNSAHSFHVRYYYTAHCSVLSQGW